MTTLSDIAARINALQPGEVLTIPREEIEGAGLAYDRDEVDEALEPLLPAGLLVYEFQHVDDYGRHVLKVTRLAN